jgi:hypothetical protein
VKVPRLVYAHLLLNTFEFTSHRTSYNSTIYRPIRDDRIMKLNAETKIELKEPFLSTFF